MEFPHTTSALGYAIPPTASVGTVPLVVRVERALILLAFFIELDGEVHIPMYEKLEAELEALKHQQDTRNRARERLNSFVQTRSKSDPLQKLGPQIM